MKVAMIDTDTVLVRYVIDDVDAALAFYTTHLGFAVQMHPAPTFAILARGALRLALSAPSGQGGIGHHLTLPVGRVDFECALNSNVGPWMHRWT